MALVSTISDCFANLSDSKLGITTLMDCKIETVPGTIPVCKYFYPLAPVMWEKMDKILSKIKLLRNPWKARGLALLFFTLNKKG